MKLMKLLPWLALLALAVVYLLDPSLADIVAPAMIISTPSLQGLRVTLETRFKEGYSIAEEWSKEVRSDVPSSAGLNLYAWMASQVTLREWIGPRQAIALSEHEFPVPNKKFEATITIPREKILDDELGMYTALIAPDMGSALKKHPDRELAKMIQANPTGHDGVAFFHDAHPTFDEAGSTYDNNFTTTALTYDNFNTVYSAMAAYKGENGEVMGVTPTHLLVPPQLRRVALEITEASNLIKVAGSGEAASIDNVMKGWVKPVVVPEFANQATTWYLVDCSRAIKPFVWQVRSNGILVALQDATDPSVFFSNEFTWGIDGDDGGPYRVAPTVSLPFLAAKAVA